MLRILKAKLDLAVGKIQFHLTKIYVFFKVLLYAWNPGDEKEELVMDSAL